MHHRLFIAARIEPKGGSLEERRADATDISMAENAKTAVKELLLHAIALDILSIEKSNQGVGHR